MKQCANALVPSHRPAAPLSESQRHAWLDRNGPGPFRWWRPAAVATVATGAALLRGERS